MSKAIVLLDYENVHKILGKYGESAQSKDLFVKIREYCKTNGLDILDIIVYCNFDRPELTESFHQTWLQQNNIEVRHTSNNGKNYADLQIAIDALEQVYRNNNVNAIVLFSSDKDMIPLVKAIRRNDKSVYWITSVQDCAPGMDLFPNKHEILETLLNIKDASGNPIVAITKTHKDIVYEFIKEFISNSSKQPNTVSVEYIIKNLLERKKLLRTDILRHLSELENENKITVYEYEFTTPGGTPRNSEGIIPDSKVAEYSTTVPKYRALTGYFSLAKVTELLGKKLS